MPGKPNRDRKDQDASLLPSIEGLTPKQYDILVALIESGSPLTRTELAERAHVDRKTVWSAFQTPAFVEAYNQVCLFLLKERVGEILEASIREAKRHSFPDRQMLLQMAGLFTPTSRAEVTGRDGKPVQIETIVGIVREAANRSDPPHAPSSSA
jgi:hypothetical protein